MKLLVISPDYLSHYLPMSAVASAARRRGWDVTIATGRALRATVEADGSRWRELRMSRGSNPGLLSDRSVTQSVDDDLRAFFAATADGMVPALYRQALDRGPDLLWEPQIVAAGVVELLDRERPDTILVDHLAFSTTLALRAMDRPFTTFVAGHPTQLPSGDEVFGYPTAWPSCISADDAGLAGLHRLCQQVTGDVTDRYNEVLLGLSPSARPVADAFAAHGDDVLFNSPEVLTDPGRAAVLPARHAFLGSCVRAERPDAAAASWLRSLDGQAFVYVSLGTFLSARADVLGRIVSAMRRIDVPVALATGIANPADFAPAPASWLVARSLPQVALLEGAAVVVTHGGNNTMTEALTNGCPIVVLPFSTDQFAVAADLERHDLGVALDPNRATSDDIIDAARWATSGRGPRALAAVAAALRSHPGADLAVDRLQASVDRAGTA